MKSFRILQYNLKTFFHWRNISIILLLFTLNYALFNNMYRFQSDNSIDSLILLFYGPFNVLVDSTRWLFIQVPILVMVGLFIEKELTDRALYVLIRIGSVPQWLMGKLLASCLFVTFYYIVGLSLSYLFLILFHESLKKNNVPETFQLMKMYSSVPLLFHLLFLLILSTCSLVILNTLLTFVLRNSIVSFSFIIILIYLSIAVMSFYPVLSKWLPPSQGMLINHELAHFSFLWSYLYLFSLLYILVASLLLIGRKKLSDLTNSEVLYE